MNDNDHTSLGHAFELWVRGWAVPLPAFDVGQRVERLVRHDGDYRQDTDAGRLFQRLRNDLSPREFMGLPQAAQDIMQGVPIAFAIDEERKREHEARIGRIVNRANEQINVVHRMQMKLGELRRKHDICVDALSAELTSLLQSNYISIDRRVAQRWQSLAEGTRIYNEAKSTFVRKFAADGVGLSLDEEQAAAVGAVNGNVLVTARAGSGKTRVLTARALFLHLHCGVPVHHIMLLAFNRRAASEIESRLREWLGDDIPHVMTFHALAYALVHPS